MNGSNAFLIESTWNSIITKTPIKILYVNMDDIFPVKFRYKGKGYKDLIFLARLSEVEFK